MKYLTHNLPEIGLLIPVYLLAGLSGEGLDLGVGHLGHQLLLLGAQLPDLNELNRSGKWQSMPVTTLNPSFLQVRVNCYCKSYRI